MGAYTFKRRKGHAMRNLMIGIVVLGLAGALAVTSGCESSAGKGAGIGTLVGAGAGALIGSGSGKAGEGALIGGAVGAGTGYVIGNEKDKKQARQQQDAAYESANTYVVNVQNSNGSTTPVTIRRAGDRWVGPRGEYYSVLPTAEQLRPVYGF